MKFLSESNVRERHVFEVYSSACDITNRKKEKDVRCGTLQ